jgi:hypothetical protein
MAACRNDIMTSNSLVQQYQNELGQKDTPPCGPNHLAPTLLSFTLTSTLLAEILALAIPENLESFATVSGWYFDH